MSMHLLAYKICIMVDLWYNVSQSHDSIHAARTGNSFVFLGTVLAVAVVLATQTPGFNSLQFFSRQHVSVNCFTLPATDGEPEPPYVCISLERFPGIHSRTHSAANRALLSATTAKRLPTIAAPATTADRCHLCRELA